MLHGGATMAPPPTPPVIARWTRPRLERPMSLHESTRGAIRPEGRNQHTELTAARHMSTSKQLANQVTTDSHHQPPNHHPTTSNHPTTTKLLLTSHQSPVVAFAPMAKKKPGGLRPSRRARRRRAAATWAEEWG